MARTHAAPTNGWQAPQSAAPEHDPRNQRTAAPGQRPVQPAPAAGYPPQGGYPGQPGANPAYDPQHAGYHYPQQHPAAAAPAARQGLSGLDSGPQSFGHGHAGPQPFAQGAQPRGFVAPGAATAAFRPRQPDAMAAAAGYDQWSVPMQGQDPRAYDLGNYMPTGTGREGDPLQQQADWPHAAYGDPTQDPAYQAAQLGYEQGHALEQAYSHEEGGEYEAEEPRRGNWAMRIAGAIVVAVGLGYGLAQGYKLVAGTSPDGMTPVVRGDDAPTKTKPSEPGGKQFAHTDSKVMGRLGEPAPSNAPADASASSAPSSEAETDPSGTRKVTTVVVGRDGSIVPPEPPSEPGAAQSTVAVDGVTMVDGFGGQYPGGAVTTASTSSSGGTQSTPAATTPRPLVVKPPAAESRPVAVTSSTSSTTSPATSSTTTPAASAPPDTPSEPTTTAALQPSEASGPVASSASSKKTAAVAKEAEAPAAPAATGGAQPSAGGSNGYVVVLASVPASGGSRLVALKKFADMQQQYGSVLQNKTPDVREANLGQKGIYHRLLVGPPGSRAQASTLCSELKSAGYKDCWVTAY